MLRKIYLNTYRAAGFAFLFTIAGSIFVLFASLIFFFFNASWIAPGKLSPTSDKMVSYSQAYQSSYQNTQSLQAAVVQASADYNLALHNASKYASVKSSVASSDSRLAVQIGKKQVDLGNTQHISAQLESQKANINSSLRAGLITQTEAAAQISGIQSFHNSVVDGNIASITANAGSKLTVAQTEILLNSANADIATKKNQLTLAQQTLQSATKQLNVLKSTVYYQILTKGDADLAFVPYENLDNVVVGQNVYDCYLMVVGCYKVGTVMSIQTEEQIVEFPVFNLRFTRNMRGVFVLLNIDKGSETAMRSKLLFFGHKPLFI